MTYQFDDLIQKVRSPQFAPEAHKLRSVIGDVETFEREEGQTVWSLVRDKKIPVNVVPTVVFLNDVPLMRKDWDRPILSFEQVTFVTIPQGSIFKDIIRLIATLALAVIAPWAAGIIGGIIGITGGIGLSLIQAGIVIAGSFLINALLPPTTPDEPNTPSPSPTYSLQAQGNAARLFQPIPKQYGEHIMYCDFASQPYYVFENNQQILYQLFCRGLGKYQTTKVRVEDTEVWDSVTGYNEDFVGLEIEFIDPGQPITLFPSEVITSPEVSGMDMPHWWARDPHVNYQWFDFTPDGKITATAGNRDITWSQAVPGQKIRVPAPSINEGEYTIIDIDPSTRWVKVNAVLLTETWQGIIYLADESQWIGGYVANPPDTVTDKLQVDFFFPRGIYFTNESGGYSPLSVSAEVQAQVIDSAGLPLTDWITIGLHTYTRNTNTPQRITETYDVDEARYKVRVRRTSLEDPRPYWGYAMQWGSLRAFIPNDNNYPNVSLMAVKMTATGQLSQQASRRFNVIQTAILPVYQAVTEVWIEQPTRGIAWAAFDIVTNTDYGGELDPLAIDLDQLVYLDSVWEDRGDHFDGIFDTQQSCWDALVACLRCGRTMPVLLAGMLTFRRRENALVPRGIFTPNNIVRGSFETEHMLVTDDTPDDIIVEFLDKRTWKRNEVRCVLPDSDSEKPERQQIFGIIEREHAFREGIFAAAFNAYNRVVAQFTTELEGRLLLRSDIIYAAHDLYEWGQWGQVLYYVPDDLLVQLDRPVEIDNDTFIMFRKRNGIGWGPVKIVVGEVDDQVIIDEADLALVEADQGALEDVWAYEDDQVQTPFIICKSDVAYKRFSVVSGNPNDDTVDLVVIADDPKVHVADEQEPPAETYPYTPGFPNRPVIPTFSVVKQPASPDSAPIIDWNWGAASPVATDGYILQISYDGFNWDTAYTGSGTSHSATVFPGKLYSRVRGIAGIGGPWKNHNATFGTAVVTPLPPTNLVVEADIGAGTITSTWSQGVRATSYNIELWVESTVDSTVFDVKKFDIDEPSLGHTFVQDEILGVGGPWKNIQVKVYSVNSDGLSTATMETLTDIGLGEIDNLELVYPYVDEIALQWTPADQAEFYDVVFKVGGITKHSATTQVPTYTYTKAAIENAGGPWATVTCEVTPRAGTMSGTTETLVVNETDIFTWDSGDVLLWDSEDVLTGDS